MKVMARCSTSSRMPKHAFLLIADDFTDKRRRIRWQRTFFRNKFTGGHACKKIIMVRGKLTTPIREAVEKTNKKLIYISPVGNRKNQITAKNNVI